MALVADSFVVVARRDALDARYPGGEAGFLAAAPNATACRDGSLCSVWFMVQRDARAFMAHLASTGLQGPGDDFTLFDARTGQHHPAPWLASVTLPLPAHDGSGSVPVPLLYLEGTALGHVCAPAGHKIGSTRWLSDHELAAYEFVDEVRGVTTLRHRETGELRYIGGTGAGSLELRFALLSARVWALAAPPVGPVSGELGTALAACIEQLDPLRQALDGDARCTLLLGVCHRRLGQWALAEKEFRRLTEQRPAFVGGWLDLVWALGEQGRHADALPIARRAVALEPTNPAALGNLAATLLALEALEECRAVVSSALSIAPDDAVNRAIATRLDARERARRPWWKWWG